MRHRDPSNLRGYCVQEYVELKTLISVKMEGSNLKFQVQRQITINIRYPRIKQFKSSACKSAREGRANSMTNQSSNLFYINKTQRMNLLRFKSWIVSANQDPNYEHSKLLETEAP